MLSKVLVLASGLTLASAAARQSLCSSENTGSGYTAVTNIYQSISACALNCGDDYTWAVLQDADCWCTNDEPKETVDFSECSTKCPGYPIDSCGNTDKGLYTYVTSSGNSGTGAYVQSVTASSGLANATTTPTSSWNGTASGNSTSGLNSNGTYANGSEPTSSNHQPGTGAAGKGYQISWVASALALSASVAFML